MDFDPFTGELWTTVNERDGLGEDVPPDFLTRVVDGAFYGWPYVYFGTYPDPTHAKAKSRTGCGGAQKIGPRAGSCPWRAFRAVGSAILSRQSISGKISARCFCRPARWRGALAVAWFRRDFYAVLRDGAPTGEIEPFLTGFIEDYDQGTVHGRPGRAGDVAGWFIAGDR